MTAYLLVFLGAGLGGAMRHAVIAGRLAYLAGRIQKRLYATASSPLEGVIGTTS